jgi:hypothetical protein
MRVYNLSERELVYKSKTIPPNGGSAEFPGLSFIPDRDKANKCLAFGSLPRGWKAKTVPVVVVKPVLPPVAPVAVQAVETPSVVDMPLVAMAEEAAPKEGKRNKRY